MYETRHLEFHSSLDRQVTSAYTGEQTNGSILHWLHLPEQVLKLNEYFKGHCHWTAYSRRLLLSREPGSRGFYRPFCGPDKAMGLLRVCLSACQDNNLETKWVFDLDMRFTLKLSRSRSIVTIIWQSSRTQREVYKRIPFRLRINALDLSVIVNLWDLNEWICVNFGAVFHAVFWWHTEILRMECYETRLLSCFVTFHS